MGLTPGSGKSPGGRHDNPLQYSCLENPISLAWRIPRTERSLALAGSALFYVLFRLPAVWLGLVPTVITGLQEWKLELSLDTYANYLGKLPLLANYFGQSKPPSQHRFKEQEKGSTFYWEEPKMVPILQLIVAGWLFTIWATRQAQRTVCWLGSKPRSTAWKPAILTTVLPTSNN